MKLKLSDFAKISSSKRIFANEYTEEGIPFYRGKEIIEKANRKPISQTLYISKEKFSELEEKHGVPKKDDILLTAVGTLGITYLVTEDDKFYYKDGNVVCIRVVNDEIYPKFVYLWTKSQKFMELININSIGSTQRAITINTLNSFEIDIPPFSEQKRIADILTSLDDKIELNNQMNQTLEEMAKVLYKQWFVDFEFPNEDGKPYKSSGGEMVESELGLIPKGWEVKELGEFFPIITGKKNANAATDNGKYRFFTCSQNYSLTDNFEFDAGAILVAGNGDFSVKWYRGKFDAYQRTYVLIPHNQKKLALLFVIIKECLSDITKGSHGSVIKFLTKGMLENYKIAWPADVDVFSSVFTDLNLKIEKNNSEIESLRLQKQVLLEELI